MKFIFGVCVARGSSGAKLVGNWKRICLFFSTVLIVRYKLSIFILARAL